MARVSIPNSAVSITNPEGIREFLEPYGISYEHWDSGAGRVAQDAGEKEILEAYAPEIERLKRERGYVTADVINVTPATPGLEDMLEKFNKEHAHSEDEVRFVVKGRGIFHINPVTAPVFAIEMEPGDLINVPAGTRHWFNLCKDRTIRAIRLFQDVTGWTPHYLEQGVHARYQQRCFEGSQ